MRLLIAILLSCLVLEAHSRLKYKATYAADLKPLDKIADTLYNTLDAVKEHVDQFMEFAEEFEKSYTSESEVVKRFTIFTDNLKKIEKLNSNPADTATYGINMFADLTTEEFQRKLSLLPPNLQNISTEVYNGYYPIQNGPLPGSFDWRSKGVISGVKNQGNCGSCWAFASIAVLEARAAIQQKGMNSYSEQQLVDCIEGGCNGGVLAHAFGYLKDFGAMSASDYPYRASRGRCESHPVRMKFAQVVGLPRDETNLAHSLVDGGPFAVGFQVPDSFQHYKSGVVNDQNCQNKGWHAVAVVGFGSDYWLLKNSWGDGFGDHGYVRVARGRNWCHITEMAISGWV